MIELFISKYYFLFRSRFGSGFVRFRVSGVLDVDPNGVGLCGGFWLPHFLAHLSIIYVLLSNNILCSSTSSRYLKVSSDGIGRFSFGFGFLGKLVFDRRAWWYYTFTRPWYFDLSQFYWGATLRISRNASQFLLFAISLFFVQKELLTPSHAHWTSPTCQTKYGPHFHSTVYYSLTAHSLRCYFGHTFN